MGADDYSMQEVANPGVVDLYGQVLVFESLFRSGWDQVTFISIYRYSDIGKSIDNVDSWLETPTPTRAEALWHHY